MGIKRYFAEADNTITNAYKSGLKTRGTGSNMGQSDILEVFSIYAQASTTSTEYARVLIQFPISNLSSDRTNGVIPASGSVSFYLRMFNAEHSETLPRNYTLEVSGVSAQWEEGNGLDMVSYTDLTYDEAGSNWINANNNFVSASANLTALSKTAGEANTRKLTVADAAANSVEFTIDNSTSTSTATVIGFSNANSNATQFATNIAAAINAANTAGTLNVVASSDGATVTLTQTALGLSGNDADDISGTAITDSVITIVSQFAGGDGQWVSNGGDYHSDISSSFSQTFDIGDEDLEIDVTTLVEQWINSAGNVLGSKTNYGFGIKLKAFHESETKSYYTKKFFARSSEFFFKRPVLEARFDDRVIDDRGNFYLSSSLATGADNLNTIYLYNYIRGRLTNIPSITSSAAPIYVSIFSGSSDNSAPSASALILTADSNHVNTTNQLVVTGGQVSTGIYSASFAFTGSDTLDNVYDVWFSGSDEVTSAEAASVQYHTGSISISRFESKNHNQYSRYLLSMPSLKSQYYNNQTERFRIYIREKNWSPTIYSKAVATPETLTFESASYEIFRLVDDKVVVAYGTGSNYYSLLSSDVSGNYFDLDMSMLEPGYSYGIRYSIYQHSVQSYTEQPYVFKFRVSKYDY
jgi:hypothetical protein